MAAVTIEKVTKSVNAFVKKDINLIREVEKMDNIVDGLFDTIKNELIELSSKAPETGGKLSIF